MQAPTPKLIALDLDGTTLDSSGHISERTKRAVAAVQALGIGVIVVTFRAYLSSKPFVRELGLHLPLIRPTGLIKDASDDRFDEFRCLHTLRSRPWSTDLSTGSRCVFAGESYVGNLIIRRFGVGHEDQWVASDDLRDVAMKQLCLALLRRSLL